MSRGHITISSINMVSRRPVQASLFCLALIPGALPCAQVLAAQPVVTQEIAQEVDRESGADPDTGPALEAEAAVEFESVAEPASLSNPFGDAANAPAASMSLPNRRDESGTSIAEILEELDPDLEQMQAQIEAGEYEIPKYWLSQKIRELEKSSHRFEPALVRPLTLQGDIQVLEGDYVGALDSYGRAVHLERVNSGLVSAAQLEIVYREAEVYRTLGDFETANEREEYAYHVLQHAYDPYSEEVLPGLFHLAGWYERTHNIFAARHLYQRAADVMVANGKGQTLEAIPAWQGVARTYRLERFPPVYIDSTETTVYSQSAAMQDTWGPVSINNFPAGERALQTIIQIHRIYDSPIPDLAQSILDLADWHLLFERTREAYPLYQIAYEMMESVEGFPVADFFSVPKLIHFPAPLDPSPPELPDSNADGLVSVKFEVTDRGAPRRLETIESVPQGMMDFRVRKSLRASRFRPALVEGVPTATSEYTYTHRFVYYPQLAVGQTTEEVEE